jgi:hypothetical protein
MKTSFAKWAKFVTLYLLSIPVIAAGWHYLAPRAECYVNDENICIWQVDQTSSPYFFADAIFGGVALVVGLLLAFVVARSLQPSWRNQLTFAGLGIAIGWVAKTVAESFNAVELLESPFAIDALEMRSTAMLFVLPLVVQLFVVFRTPLVPKGEPVSESEPAAQ